MPARRRRANAAEEPEAPVPAPTAEPAATAKPRRSTPATRRARKPAAAVVAETVVVEPADVRPEFEASMTQARAAGEELRREVEAFRAQLQTLRSEAREAVEQCQAQLDSIQQQRRLATEELRQAEEFVGRAQADAQSARINFEQVVQASIQIERSWQEAREQHTQAHDAARKAEEALLEARGRFDDAHAELQAARSEADEALEQARRIRDESQSLREAPAVAEPVAAVPNGPVSESSQDRLVRYVNDAWALEHNAVDMFQNMAEEVTDPHVREALEDYRSLSHAQQERLARRLDALGHEPSGSKGVLHQMMSRIWDTLHRPRDEADRTLQDLIQGLGSVHFAIAMYQALETYARAANDEVTAELANELLREEIDAAERLRPLLTPAAVRAVVPA